ncbi:MAG: outer membrane beta-barrel protein [Chitinophagaceae bacterium]|nr:outer membrane beta-barrel protein [Chitinophagaceae bacterium]MCB9044842.1 outer membrane beta-barrel protein [Chitinophagales bacterium]
MYIKKIGLLFALSLLLNNAAKAQEEEKTDGKVGKSISISQDGISFDKGNQKDKPFYIDFFVLDIGLNSIQDKSNYTSTAAQTLLQVPDDYQNENLFSLRSGKSWNVNIWPVLPSWRLVNGDGQKIFIGSGVGLQMYNFRFNKPVTYANNVNPVVFLDSTHTFKKNKLAVTYLSIPLMLTFKTKAAKKAWIVYGFGITGGYRITSHMKQISKEDGKQKDHDKFNLNDFNSCATAEIGLDGYFRLYASYQITALHDNGLDQHPLSIGLRIGGI